MKKGELRFAEILMTAEKLFFEKGYEETSVQDILDALNMSKGGFYHYFQSKAELLEAICRRNAEKSIEKLRRDLAGKIDPVRKLNLILSQTNLFVRETPAFCATVLRVGFIENDVSFREKTRAFLLSELQPLAEQALAEGLESDALFTRYPAQTARMLLMLGGNVCDEACRILLDAQEETDRLLDVIECLNAYREACETLSGAVFGSMELFDAEQMMKSFRQTLDHLRKTEEE